MSDANSSSLEYSRPHRRRSWWLDSRLAGSLARTAIACGLFQVVVGIASAFRPISISGVHTAADRCLFVGRAMAVVIAGAALLMLRRRRRRVDLLPLA